MNRTDSDFAAMAIGLAAALFFASPVWPSQARELQVDEKRKLETLEREIEAGEARTEELEQEAARLAAESRELSASLVKAAKRVRAKETEVTYLEQRLADLDVIEKAKTEALSERREELVHTIAALQRLGRRPDATLLVHPGTAIATVRSAALLSAVVPELESRAKNLGQELSALSRVRADILSERKKLAAATSALNGERQAINRLARLKAQKHKKAEAKAARERERLAQMAAEAQTLRELIDRLVAAPFAPGAPGAPGRGGPSSGELGKVFLAGPPFSSARGALPLAARGIITMRFGDKNSLGLATKGITVKTRPFAQVIAPYDGRIVFAGPFRDYGQLLIIGHGEGYHTLLAGFSRIDGIVGQWILAGEPVGQMGNRESKQGKTSDPALYVELRRNGEPVNPLPWLAASERKVSGL